MNMYLDPKNDLTFKKIFGQHPHLLKSFLNALLPLDEGCQIESLEYLPSDMVPENPFKKHSIVDVRCIDNRGRQFIVEMQMQWTDSFMQRVLFNASKAYVRQLENKKPYAILTPVYALNLVNEVFQPNKKEYYHHYKIVNLADTDQQIEGLEFIFIELPKFQPESITEKKLHVLWLRFLTEINHRTRIAPPELHESKEISQALDILRESAFTDIELEVYDKYWDDVRIEIMYRNDFISYGQKRGIEKGIKKGLKKGMKEGVEKGMKEGVEKGMKEGVEKGMKEGVEKGMKEGVEKGMKEGVEKGMREGAEKGAFINACTIALKAIERNMTINEITTLTGLPETIVNKLIQLHKKHGSNATEFIHTIQN